MEIPTGIPTGIPNGNCLAGMFPNHADTVTQCILTWSELTRYTKHVPLTRYDTARVNTDSTRFDMVWI